MAETKQEQPQSLTASAAWAPHSPAALRQRIAEQGTTQTLTRDEVLDRALLRAQRREG
jgi:hypothetical protein